MCEHVYICMYTYKCGNRYESKPRYIDSFQADDNNLERASQAGVTTNWEREGHLHGRTARFGATPARSYGLLMREVRG